jgi:PGF-CTERM protein
MSKRKRIESPVLIGMLLMGVIGMGIVSTAIASGAATTTDAVQFSTLIEFLPDAPSGWTGEEPFGMVYTVEDGTWSMATENYAKSDTEDVTAAVVVTDYAFYTLGWTAAWKGFHAYETTEGYAKTVTVNGYPAWEVYTKDGGDYALYVGINDRFLAIITTNSDKDTLYDFADKIDYKGIAALGGGAAPPTETEQPTEAPATHGEEGGETPGFEAVFAVVGLLAVVALLGRRG